MIVDTRPSPWGGVTLIPPLVDSSITEQLYKEDEEVTVATLRFAVTPEALSFQLIQCFDEFVLLNDPVDVLIQAFVAKLRRVAFKRKGVAPLGRSADVDVVELDVTIYYSS